MGGGLMQLVAYGAQDIYLTGNPQITFFKVVYRRHTNFSMESIIQTFSGRSAAGGSILTATISRNGDLVHRMWLDVELTNGPFTVEGAGSDTYFNWTNNTGHAFVKECEVEIGGQRIDRHYSQWLDVWNELTDHEESEWQGLNKHAAKNTYLKSGKVFNPSGRLYIPLQFWFCRNPGLALPLIALQYHEVKVKLTTRAVVNLVNSNGGAITDGTAPGVALYCDYIYLDTDERRRFAQVSHEYLIEQVQREQKTSPSAPATTHNQDLNFNHPVKELIWTVQATSAAKENGAGGNTDATLNVDASVVAQGNDYFCYSSNNANLEVINGTSNYEGFSTAKLQLNGHDRFSARKATYFRTCQPQQHGHKVPSKHIYSYSFALKPEEHQPSGTCNFSRIDKAQLQLTANDIKNCTVTVYAVNYNVLRIMSGMGGLAYSN